MQTHHEGNTLDIELDDGTPVGVYDPRNDSFTPSSGITVEKVIRDLHSFHIRMYKRAIKVAQLKEGNQ